MTSQEKIEYLKQYRKADERINQKCEELAMWRSRATKVTTTLSDMPRGGSGEDKLQTAVERIVEIQMQINAEIDSLVDLRREIARAISTVSDTTLQTLLLYRYIDGLTWEKISVALNYDVEGKNIYKLHGKAIYCMHLDTELHL